VARQRQEKRLAQLRKNTRKRPDKTSGRKHPHLEEVDVVPAGDQDEQETEAIQAAIINARQPTSPTSVPGNITVNIRP